MSDDDMDLRTFVTEAITQIVLGVVDAQKAVEAHGARINPQTSRVGASPQQLYFLGPGGLPIESVKFDVAVTLDKTDSKKGRIGVAAVLGAGVEGGIDVRNQTANRITFAVPLSLPVHRVKSAAQE